MKKFIFGLLAGILVSMTVAKVQAIEAALSATTIRDLYFACVTGGLVSTKLYNIEQDNGKAGIIAMLKDAKHIAEKMMDLRK